MAGARPDRIPAQTDPLNRSYWARDEYARDGRLKCTNDGIFRRAQVAKCAWFTCAATRKALAATVKLGFKPALDGKNDVSTT